MGACPLRKFSKINALRLILGLLLLGYENAQGERGEQIFEGTGYPRSSPCMNPWQKFRQPMQKLRKKHENLDFVILLSFVLSSFLSLLFHFPHT